LVDDFATIGAWSASNDGGQITVSQGPAALGEGRNSVRLQYPDEPVHWGNAARNISLPANASAIEFDVKVISSDPKTIGCIWLTEKDGDAWRANWSYNEVQPDLLPVGWSHVRVPFTAFTFSPRGDKVKAMSTVVRALIGFTAGRADVLVSRLRLETQDAPDTTPLPVTPKLVIDRSGTASVAVFSADYPHRVSDSDPVLLASTLKAAGFGVTILKPGDLADAAVFNRANFDVLIMPYGGRYPITANDSIRLFLKKRGTFLSTGGYSFDEPVGATLPTVSSLTSPVPSPLGSRPIAGHDVLILTPDQVPVFDTGNLLQLVATTHAAPDQTVIPSGLKLPDGPLTGYAATAMLGNSNALIPTVSSRRVPLLMAYDEVGRERGAVGSLVYNFSGPWHGSAFAIFGVTNTDLFAANGILIKQLPSIVKALLDRTYIRTVRTDLRHYEAGEAIRSSAFVENQSNLPITATVTFTVTDRGGTRVGESVVSKVTITPHTRWPVEAQLHAAIADSDLYTVTAKMTGAGLDDVIRTGYTVARKDIRALGFQMAWRGNYFQDGNRPLLASGVNMTSSVLYSDLENPLQWDIDLARIRESGISVVRVIGANPWYDPITHADSMPAGSFTELPKGFLRNLDSFVQLAQRHHLALLLDLCDWGTRVAVSQADRDRQIQVAKLLTEHFRGIPGIFYDLSNEPIMKTEYMRAVGENRKKYEAAWTEFLTTRYATDDGLATAWGVAPGKATLALTPIIPGAAVWSDRRTFDYEEFWAGILGRWVEGLSTSIHSADPSRLDLVGYLEGYGITNKARAQDSLSLSAIHSYAAIDDVRNDVQLFDHRVMGQGTSITEYGDLANHWKRRLGIDNGGSDTGRFLRTAHTVYGQGGFLTAWWLWKDMDDTTFPYGLNTSGSGPRRNTALATRNAMLVFRAVRPLYKPAGVYVVADPVELGGATGVTVVKHIYNIFDDLRSRQVDFAAIDTHHLANLPPTAKVLIYPAAFTIPDDAYVWLRKFVQAGGTVCLGGDFSFDANRRRTRGERLAEFGGFTTTSTSVDPWGESRDVAVTTGTVQAGCVVNSIGKGKVISTLDPACLSQDGKRYAYVTALESLPSTRITVPTPVIVSRLPEVDGARSYFACNPTSSVQLVTIAAEKTPVTITTAAYGVGFVRYDAAGNVTSLESQGDAKIGGMGIPITGHVALVAPQYTPLTTATSMVVVPFGAGKVDLSPFTALNGVEVRALDFRDGKTIECSKQKGPTVNFDDESGYEFRIVAPTSRQQVIADWARGELELRATTKGDIGH
jgi:hypothetical protein